MTDHGLESSDGIISRSPGAVRSRAEGASIVQVETVGKGLLIIVVAMLCIAMIVAIGAMWWASNATTTAAVAAERAAEAEQAASISEIYAKQVFVELNRLGYPVKSPAEEHSIAPVEDVQ